MNPGIWADYDDDTVAVMRIATTFLSEYWGYDPAAADELMSAFMKAQGDRFDEDFVHEQSAYRMAAIVHYIQGLGGDWIEVGNWLLREGHHNQPREALEYFNDHYYKR